jgi:hypothetical protein
MGERFHFSILRNPLFASCHGWTWHDLAQPGTFQANLEAARDARFGVYFLL